MQNKYIENKKDFKIKMIDAIDNNKIKLKYS